MSTRSRLAALTLISTIALPGIAMAQDGFSRSSTWLRAGPSSDYPRVAHVARGEPLDIHGCLSGRSWCDVSADGDRGWLRGSSIDYVYNGRRIILSNPAAAGIAILSFGMADYWDSYYRDRSWYRDTRYWRGRDRDRAPDRRPDHDRPRPGPDRPGPDRPGPDRPGAHDGRPGPERPDVRPPPQPPHVTRPRPEPPREQVRPPRPERPAVQLRPERPAMQPPRPERPHMDRPRPERPALQPQRPPQPRAEQRRPAPQPNGAPPRRCPPGGDCR